MQVIQLRDLGAATVYEVQGAKGALDSGMKPIDPTFRLAGTALTVDARRSDNLVLHLAVLKAQPGNVLVVDAKGFMEVGPWGDVLTIQAMKLGIAGLVIDGCVRDANLIIGLGSPIFCRGLSIKGTGKTSPARSMCRSTSATLSSTRATSSWATETAWSLLNGTRLVT